MKHNGEAPIRNVTDVGPGDYVKIGDRWECIFHNTAYGKTNTPRQWQITTEEGGFYDMWDIALYAKEEDMVAAGGGKPKG